MSKYLKVNIYSVLLLCLVSVTESVAQTFTGTELLARPTDHSITLNVVSSSALYAYVECGLSSGLYTITTSTVNKAANEPIVIVIDGLSANTKYYYRLRYSTSGSGTFLARAEHTFTMQKPIGSTFTFDVTSDSHVNIMLGSAATWQQTLTNVANDNPDFLIDLGDTFAMDGVSTYATADANYLFQRTSTALGLVSPSVPIFIVVGNHENEEGWHISDNEAIWATNAQKRYFPNPVPDASFYSGNTDTYSALNGDKLHEDYYAWTWGDALFVTIDPFWYTTAKPFIGNTGGGEPGSSDGDRWHWTLGDTQYAWLKQTLENSHATYKFLFMHHPTGGTDDYIRGGAAAGTYCEWGGYNEDGTTWGFTTKRPTWSKPIHQILVDNGVTAVFHGHDHQYGYEKRDGIVYQALPAAGFSGNGFGEYTTGVGYTIKALPSPGHLRVTVTPSQTTVDYINTSGGGVAYSYTILSNLNVNSSAGLTLNNPMTISGALTFTLGNLILGNNDLTISGTVNGAADGKSIVTNGTGKVIRTITAGGGFIFPVGTATRYNPVSFTSASGGTYTAAIVSGEVPATKNDEASCKKTWTITGTNPANVTFTWNSADMGGSCVPTSCIALRYDGTAWTDIGGVTSGSDPIYTTTLTNVTSFSPWTIGNAGALPVEMTSFTAVAQNMSAQLKWNTATEVNNYGFEIERRAITSNAWAKVGFVAGNGTSNIAHSYTYADNNLSSGKYAYRLKQIDNDGAFKYSASTEVEIIGVPKELKLYVNYPNPFNPSTKVQFTVPENGNVRLLVYNVIGQEVATLFNGAAEAGNIYTVNFDGSHMASGLYLSVLEFGTQRITHKMMMTK
jgi:hypothetical protein